MSKRQQIREKRRKQQQRRRLFVIGLVAAGAILVVAALIIAGTRTGSTLGKARPMVKDNHMGDPNAPVRVEEFSDFLCSHCRDFALQQEPGIVEKYIAPGKVYFTYIPYSFLAPQSKEAAEAAYCAMDQGKFWEFKDLLFSSSVAPVADPFTKTSYLSYAQKLRLDTAAFSQCLDSKKYAQRVQEDLDYGKSKGVEGTPTFFVNDRMVYASELEAAIERELASSQ